MRGLIIAAKFSLGCNEAALFPEREKTLREFLENSRDVNKAKQVENILKKFRILFPYLSLIAKANRKNPFSLKVVEAYFIGNKLLEKVWTDRSLETLSQLYSPKISLPEIFVPHHNLHILIITPQVQEIKLPLSLVNCCMVKLGEVKTVKEDRVRVKEWEIVLSGGRPKIGWSNKEIPRNKVLVERLEKHDRVAIHWGFICEKLNNAQIQSLEKYTRRALKYAKIGGE